MAVAMAPTAAVAADGYQPSDAEKAKAMQDIRSVYSRDWSGAPQAPSAPSEDRAGEPPVLLPAPTFSPDVPQGTSAKDGFAALPAELQRRAKEGVFVNTRGKSPDELAELRRQLAGVTDQQVAAAGPAGASTTVLGGPGFSLYFSQLYGQFASDGKYRLVGCNIELYTLTPNPTLDIQYGTAVTCSDPKMFWGQLANLAEVLPSPLRALQTDPDANFYGGATGAHFDQRYAYRRESDAQVEQMYSYTGMVILGVKGVDGWLTQPVSTGEGIRCQNPLALGMACEIISKPFAFIPDSNYTCATGPTCDLVRKTQQDAADIVAGADAFYAATLASAFVEDFDTSASEHADTPPTADDANDDLTDDGPSSGQFTVLLDAEGTPQLADSAQVAAGNGIGVPTGCKLSAEYLQRARRSGAADVLTAGASGVCPSRYTLSLKACVAIKKFGVGPFSRYDENWDGRTNCGAFQTAPRIRSLKHNEYCISGDHKYKTKVIVYIYDRVTGRSGRGSGYQSGRVHITDCI